jgi:hypothetical protein
LAITALVLWMLTGAAGVALLRAGNAARIQAAEPAEPAPAPVRIGAIPLTAEGKPPPGPRPKVTAPPGEHPFLEFCHPALGLVGMACWFMFTFIHYRPLAWIAFGVLVVTIGAGLSWLGAARRAARRHPDVPRRAFTPRLIAVHGLGATLTFVLVVVSALVASRA